MPRENESSRTSSSRQRIQVELNRVELNREWSKPRGESSTINRQDHRIKKGNGRKEIKEERRLLGDNHRDPNAVAIEVPGHAPKPKAAPKIKKFESFNPINSLSSHKTRSLNRSPGTWAPKPNIPHQTSPVAYRSGPLADSDGEKGGPPRKRQKTNMPLDLEDDDSDILGASTVAGVGSSFNTKLGPTSPRARGGTNNAQKNTDVENIRKQSSTGQSGGQTIVRSGDYTIEESDDEEFLKSAKRERLQRAEIQPLADKQYRKQLHEGGLDVMSAVEVYKPNKTPPNLTHSGDDTRLSKKFIQVDGRRRNCDLRESPDELQGGKTVGESWKTSSQSGRQVSPSNIRHTRFSPSPKRTKKTKTTKRWSLSDMVEKKGKIASFRVRMLRCGSMSVNGLASLIYDKKISQFFVKADDDTDKSKIRDLKKAISIHFSDDNANAKVRLKFPKSQDLDGDLDIEFFDGGERDKFCNILSKEAPAITEIPKDSSWMDKLFSKAPISSDKSPLNTLKRQSPKHISADHDNNRSLTKPKRMKLNESLLNGGSASTHDNIYEKKRQTDDTAKPKHMYTHSSVSELPSHSHPPPNSEDEISIPVKPYKGPAYNTRETRSKTRNQDVWIDSDGEGSLHLSPVEKRLGRWTKPLVYPTTGKKKAEVDIHDLDRLQDNEFLNDNLIGFYIRFLEYHLERQHPEVAKRVYFFNSYFFASLTNTANGKGINYEAVQKWTRSVDIFSYDYIVVPINENAHWYVAIICNLPNVLRQDMDKKENIEVNSRASSAVGTKDDEPLSVALDTTGEGTDTSKQASEDGKDDKLQKSFTSMALADNSPKPLSSREGTDLAEEPNPAENEDWPEEEENPQPALPIKSPSGSLSIASPEKERSEELQKTVNHEKPHPTKKGSQKPRNSQPKSMTEHATIITFDSLSCQRTPTIKILREYLQQEAKSKRSFALDTKSIKGMNAQKIPRQSNFSDCGLYLLAYLEKFVQNPDSFIEKLLRKVMDENKDWPEMKPGLFRRRLRKFLFDLFDEQTTQRQGKEPEMKLLVDQNPLNILLVEENPNSGEPETKTSKPEQVEAHSKPITSVTTTPPPLKDGHKEGKKRGTIEQPTTPSRSSPRLNRKFDDTKAQSSPSIILDDEKFDEKHPVVHDSVISEMEALVADTEPKSNSPENKHIRIEVPETPPPTERPATPKATDVDATIIPSPLSTPSRRSKRNLER